MNYDRRKRRSRQERTRRRPRACLETQPSTPRWPRRSARKRRHAQDRSGLQWGTTCSSKARPDSLCCQRWLSGGGWLLQNVRRACRWLWSIGGRGGGRDGSAAAELHLQPESWRKFSAGQWPKCKPHCTQWLRLEPMHAYSTRDCCARSLAAK